MGKTKILIAEDEEPLRELYKMKFEFVGFQVILAQDGEEALEKTRKEKPDVVLLDIMMPKKSGMDTLEELKKDSKTKDTPVIMLTALFQEAVKNEALSIGASAYLVKSQVMAQDMVKLVKDAADIK